MPQPSRFIFRRLAFTGPRAETKGLDFARGVNVVWGASNSGKSFTVKSLDFMCGASSLPAIKEREGYDTCWLELDLPKSGTVTLSRALAGGAFKLFDGTFDSARNGRRESRPLAADHSSPTDKIEGVSNFLLTELDIGRKWVVTNSDGKKVSFTFRHFARYIFTEETPMMAETSPLQISAQAGDTFNKNVLKFILSGVDDSATVQVPSGKDQRIANTGKIEIVDEMIALSLQELRRLFPDDGNVETADLAAQEEKLSAVIVGLQAALAEHQSAIDHLRQDRRHAFDVREEMEGRSSEINLTLDRFALLASVYNSDVERLASLQEGAEALLAGIARPCPLCGALPANQVRTHGLEYVEQSQKAVNAEIAKIVAERADLTKAVTALKAELQSVEGRTESLKARIAALEAEIAETRPLEASSRTAYERHVAARQRLRDGLSQQARLRSLRERRAALERFRPRARKRATVEVGLNGPLGAEFAAHVQSIIRSWRFPGEPVISFDSKTHDLLLDGKNRESNGKGVRALMNAAFKIGVFSFCRSKGLPHPGTITLDSPLVTYRDPHVSRHGELSNDEQKISNTGLKDHFYNYLLGHSEDTQFIIMENDSPSFSFEAPNSPVALVTTFAGASLDGQRAGLL